MSILYRKCQNKNASSKTFGKWYGKSVMLGVISTKDLAKEIAHSTTVTYADVLAVLAEMSECMRRHLQNSERVDLDGIGQFKVGLQTAPANNSAEFTGTNVVGYRINYKPETYFIANGVNAAGHRTGSYVKDLLDGVTVKEAPKNAVVDEPVVP